ncbi:MAG TPA: prenyltransferase/squalene oxidase repeat-containing protein [Planctomycetota bacterium]|nr:prenyltransferase/squalene oxidase repeat-containing protein [Planctomycetota bacterium]
MRPSLGVLTIVLLLAASSFSQDTVVQPAPGPSIAGLGEDEAAIIKTLQERGPRDKALERGVKYLLAAQQPDGAFGTHYKTAMTGLSLMALMASGITPDDTEHGPALRRGLEFVLKHMREDGYLGHSDNSRMYGHGICTLMLTEAAGMTRDPLLERRLIEACKRSVKLILRAQAVQKGGHQGGWRYEPSSGDSDLSLTGWQTMALRSAKNIGVDVPGASIQSAITYIRSVAHPEGGFAYQGQADHPTLRGIGLLALPVCGVYDAPELAKSTAKMFADPPKWHGPWFYYRTYYSAVGMYQMGDQAWNRFYPIVDELLIPHQSADGSWPEPPGNNELGYAHTPIYSTCLAMLALGVHQHLLPIYQR